MTLPPTATADRSPRPRKALGQYFLVDRRILNRIAASADLSPHDLVVEVGPGRGALTRLLAPRVSRVVAVELDENLAAALPSRLGCPESLSVVAADARTVPLSRLAPAQQDYKVVANLPYYAANPIVRRFLEAGHPPRLLVVMVQREVAESMTARAGAMTLLSVATQFYAAPRLVCPVPPHAFRPSPGVASAVVRLELREQPATSVDNPTAFFGLVRAGFSAPRKQLRNSLSHGLALPGAVAGQLLADVNIDPRRRAETLTLEEWGALYRRWRTGGTASAGNTAAGGAP